MYRSLGDGNFSDALPTWIIAYCLDTDCFFVTNQRYFFWEYNTEFQSEYAAVDFFKSHLNVFRNKRKEILSCRCGWDVNAGLFLGNTKERFI